VNPRNKYYKFIFTENFGDFEDDIKNNNIINNNNKINDVILCTFYNKNNHYLYCGDDTGNLNCFDLNSLHQTLKNQNLSKENFLINIKKIQIKTIYKISAHKESINYINYPQEISPEIIITTGTDHYVKLFDIKNGEFIDSLKQISFKISSIPIAIKYYKNNPF
jgi:WD40 repeat protein